MHCPPIAALRVLLVCIGAGLGAQNRTAHPQETLTTLSNTSVPLGVSGASFAEARTQLLIRAVELPGPGAVLLGIEAHGQSVTSINYLDLDITVSPTSATALGNVFASNLPAPQVVFSATNHTITWNGQWTGIPLTTPYIHDGTSALVIDIQKIVDPAIPAFQTCSIVGGLPRSDLPPMAVVFGSPGSGAARATSTQSFSYPVALRLVWAASPTIRLLSDRMGLTQSDFPLGGRITHSVSGIPNDLFVNLVGQAFQPPANLPPALGSWHVAGVTMNLGIVPTTGVAVTTVPIPVDTRLVGQYFTWQSLVIAPGLTGAWFTNATDNFINS